MTTILALSPAIARIWAQSAALVPLPPSGAVQRCHREIAGIEALIRSGHPDVQGLCLGLSDWSVELRMMEHELRPESEEARRGRSRAGEREGDADLLRERVDPRSVFPSTKEFRVSNQETNYHR